MKTLTLIFLLLSSGIYAQDAFRAPITRATLEWTIDTTPPQWFNHESNIALLGQYTIQYLKDNKYSLSLFFVGGMADWFIEACRFRQEDIIRMFPTSYDKILPGYTWKRKWKNGDPTQGPKFWGSTTIFAWTTDPYHAVRSFETVCYTVAVCIHIGEKKKWYLYVVDALAHQTAKAIGGRVCMWVIEDSGLTFK